MRGIKILTQEVYRLISTLMLLTLAGICWESAKCTLVCPHSDKKGSHSHLSYKPH